MTAAEKQQTQVGDLLFAVGRMPEAERTRLQRVFNLGDGLSDQERRYVEEYCVDCDRDAVAERLKLDPGDALGIFRRQAVQRAIRDKLVEDGRYSSLNAEYVRDYIFHLMDFCPTDYFELASDGSWVITPEKFSDVPHKVKRYVQSVEVRRYGAEQQCVVKFVSKESALRLAAKYTLVEKSEMRVTVVPWDSLVLDSEIGEEKDAGIEHRIRALLESKKQ